MEEEKRAKLEAVVEELEEYRGRHTELITVYAPAGANINQIMNQLVSEQSTAQNIKSKATRNNVIDALEKLIRHLKLYKKLPTNGLALFCGNVSRKEGQADIQIWAVEPPLPLKVKFYRCDQTFVLEPLKEMMEAKEVYGLIVVDRKEATFGLLEGKSIKTLRHITSGVPGKQRAGGQSALRFERIREGMKKEFFRRVSDNAKELFFEKSRLQGILVGGPGPSKDDWLKEGQLVTSIKNKIIAVKDIGYADEHGLELLIEVSQENLANEEITKEKNLLETFFRMLAKEPEKVVYGEQNIRKALEAGAVQKLLVSKSFAKKNKELVAQLEKHATSISSEIHFVSEETQEGVQFLNMTKGLGAVLRFAI